MAEFLIVANWALPVLYLAVLADYAAAFFMRTPRGGRSVWLPAVLALHVLFLVLLALHLGRMVPVNNYEVLSVLAASTIAVYWFVELASRERRTGVFVLLAAFLMQYTSSVFLPSADLRAGAAASPAPPSGLHIIPAMVAYTALTIAAIYGLLHLMAGRDLKRHRFGLLFDRLPSLDLLGTMCWHALLLGLAFMTLAMIGGAIMYAVAPHNMQGRMESKVLAKILIGAFAWVLCAVAAVGKRFGGWPAARVSVAAVAGFMAVIAMLVTSIVLS